MKEKHNNTASELNWALRGWLACTGVIICTLAFIFVGHSNMETAAERAVAEAEQVEIERKTAAYAAWKDAQDGRVAQPEDLLVLAQSTSKVVSDLVSFNFEVVSDAEISAAERKCLAQAIYYEAGFEPVIGRMAVADVILNRVQSARYPDTICGVVFQGSHRKTGCQFSFTCDGSLKRRIHKPTYNIADNMAGAILAGVHLPVSNNATHYHADYVSPFWAPKLTQTASIGAHRFYRVPSVSSKKQTQTMIGAAQ